LGASLDHAVWFHRPFRADQWLLYSQDSPNSHGSRGFGRGLIYAADGTHFSVPDMREFLPIGVGATHTLGLSSAAVAHTHTMKNHTHAGHTGSGTLVTTAAGSATAPRVSANGL
jgi:hypothetical protein